MQFYTRNPQVKGLSSSLRQHSLDAAQLLFPQHLMVTRGNEAAFALHGFDESFCFQIGVGAFGGDDAHANAVRQRPNGRELLAACQSS